MAVGALGALLFFKKNILLGFLYNRMTQLIVLLAAAYYLCTGHSFGLVDDDVYSLFFVFIILNVATNPRSLLKLENRVCDFLGKISYGLYAYNWIAVVITINLMGRFGFISNIYFRNLYIYLVSFTLLIIFSAASYYLMERVFLRMKVRYSSVSASSISQITPPGAAGAEIPQCN
jgi:peptidoglycan/LPS O-acetylase OafA/YrhL